ncbi:MULTISPECIES: glycosyltransferase [Pseudomonas]|uniref:Glycosyltransferase n=1 Tax=Pseudomonas putida (strain DOT-T1E) TaxID=1196325 RepID=I7C512_PSEPT|nr:MULTISPECIES: glycosyltransferase [Pseudomonas]AFO48201.1 glycosyltransferase [Pseudomonas putida DOT-T1E]UZM94687.1 glycosyltransferase [Pseudomonas putida DOT-T1E]WPO31514.1 glycosyltransferase [Pseudomonas sp. BO3-4]
MNITANSYSSDVTVILLGHEQADHRERAQYYYQRAGVPCVALAPLQADSSASLCCERLAQALQRVETPFVVLALDADFILPCALGNAAVHLLGDSQVLGAQGYALGYAIGDAKVAYHKLGSALTPQVEDSAQARVRQYGAASQQAWRAVLRVPVLQAVLSLLPDTLALDFAGWRVALSYALLAQGRIARLEQTDVVCEYPACMTSVVRCEEQLAHTVRVLRQWDAAGTNLCSDDFSLLNDFVRNTYEVVEQPLLFTSLWASVLDQPRRVFGPHQFVELPYYNAAVFNKLSALEFLCHAWPTGERQFRALEGNWVRQRALLQACPNDTRDSALQRYWQALGLGLFNREVCQCLVGALDPVIDADAVRELTDWLLRLAEVPAVGLEQGLASTASGQVLAMLEAITLPSAAHQQVLEHLESVGVPQIAFVVLDLVGDDLALQATFDSLLASGIRHFKLLVLKVGKPPIITTARDTLHFIPVTADNWVAHLNQAVRQLPSEWLMLLQAGEQLLTGGLLHLSTELGQASGCQAICANEVQRDEQGCLHSVVRPGADLDLLRARPGMMSRHWLLRRQAVLDLGGYGESCPHALEFDLLLRLVEAQGMSCLGHLDDFLILGEQATEALTAQAVRALERHLGQLGYQAQVSDRGDAGLHVDYRHTTTPLVSILLVSDNASSVQACLASVLQRTRYPRYEVLLVCAGQKQGDDSGVGQRLSNRVRLLTCEPGASRNAMLNLAASQAQGEYLVLLSERCEVITPAWLESLLNEAQRPEVGVVGAGLYAADATVTHAGFQLLKGAQVYSAWLGVGGRWQHAVHGCTAVSGACMMVSKALFEQCEGMQAVSGADIELCLRVRRAGLSVVWAPLAHLHGMPLTDVDAGQSLTERWPQAFSERAYDEPLDGKAGLAWLSTL